MATPEGFSSEQFSDDALKAGFTAYERAERELRTIRIESPHGTSSLILDRQGAAIHEFHLEGERVLTSALTDWLKLVSAKRDTSHTVLPFGPNGLQPQHGASRYNDYELEYAAGNTVAMSGEDRLLGAGHWQATRLADQALYIVDEVVALGGAQAVSLGKHLYFELPEADLDRIMLEDAVRGSTLRVRRLNGTELEGEFGDLIKFLAEGEPLIYQSTSSHLDVEIPGKPPIQISAIAKRNSEYARTQFALWHRPGTDTFCVEPLVGVHVDDDGTFHNDDIPLGVGDVLRLETTLTKLY